jgi:hypothetical protein
VTAASEQAGCFHSRVSSGVPYGPDSAGTGRPRLHQTLMNNRLNNEIRSVAVKIVDQLKSRDPVTKSGIEFFAGRAGQTVEEYAMDAILQRLECDECDREDYGHFGRMRSEAA